MNNRKAFVDAQERHKAGRIKEAEQRYRKLLKKLPGNPEISFYLGLALLQTGRGSEAVRLFEATAKVAPNDPIVQDHLGQALLAAGKHKTATERHFRAKELAPNRPEILFNLGVALEKSGHIAEAEGEYRAATAFSPDFFPGIANLGSLLLTQGRYREAEPLIRKACQLNPRAQEPLANLAYLLFRLKRPAEADAALTDLLAIAPKHPVSSLLRGRQQKRDGNPEEAIKSFRCATTASLPPPFTAEAWFELGQTLDSQKDFEKAFQAFGAMNGIFESLPASNQFDRQAVPRRIERIRNWHPRPLQIPQTQDTSLTRAPVFFVGFPRSGTTLMEQVLGAHPDIVTTNEESPLDATLNQAELLTGMPLPECLEALTQQQQLELQQHFFAIARDVTGNNLTETLLVDKMPLNIVTAGLVPWVFPDARVITAIRDPRDACLSCYMQRFALNEAMIHFLSLESTVRFYTQVMGLWLEARENLGIPWIEYRYEDLVEDFTGTTRRVLDFIGLPWNENVTRYHEEARAKEIRTPSHEAVTRKIDDRAVSRWRNYVEQLAPFHDALAPFVRAFGYDPS